MTAPTPKNGTVDQGAETAQAAAVLQSFHGAWRAAAVYDENNSAYRARRQALLDVLRHVFASGEACEIVYQNDYVFFNGRRLNYDREFSVGRSLAARFGELGLGALTIHADVSDDEIDRALFALAQADRRRVDPYAGLAETWSALGLQRVTIAPLLPHAAGRLLQEAAGVDPKVARRRRAQALFLRSESVVQEFWERVRDRNSFDAALVQRVVHQLIDEVAQDEDILLEFAALKDFDEYTYYHSVNVAIYSIAVGMRLGMDRAQLSHLGLAALFHDIGKVKLPHDLVTKPQEFDEDDWEQMRRHPALGALTLASMRPIDLQVGTAMAGAFEHHLRMDLSGYPKLSRPRVIHPFSRIISLCDSFDAMTSNRVYQRDAVGPDEAIRRLLYKGREWYDPLVLKAFVHVVGVFPVGTVARLSDGTIAVVVRNDAGDLYAPEVLVVRDAQGLPVRQAVRLSTRASETGGERPHLTEILDPSTAGIQVSDYVGVVNSPEELWATATATASS